ncbi:MAG: hypothetical protein KC414_10155, partial [Romboutsia sp.]|nr:hypothetical protein [Romboutsia sp.]
MALQYNYQEYSIGGGGTHRSIPIRGREDKVVFVGDIIGITYKKHAEDIENFRLITGNGVRSFSTRDELFDYTHNSLTADIETIRNANSFNGIFYELKLGKYVYNGHKLYISSNNYHTLPINWDVAKIKILNLYKKD